MEGRPIRQSTVPIHTVARLPLLSSQVRWERAGERFEGGRWREGGKSTEHRNDRPHRPQARRGHRAYQAEDGKGRTENRQQTTDGCKKDGQNTQTSRLSRWGHQVDWRPTPPAPPCAVPSSICGFDFIVVPIPSSLSTLAWLARPPTGECESVSCVVPWCDELRCVALRVVACCTSPAPWVSNWCALPLQPCTLPPAKVLEKSCLGGDLRIESNRLIQVFY